MDTENRPGAGQGQDQGQDQSHVQSHEPCPQCGAAMPVHADHVVWCRACDWNVAPELFVFGVGRTASLRRESAGRQAARVFQELVGADRIGRRSRLTPAHLASYAVATVVHGVALGIAAWAVLILVAWWWNPLMWVVGLAMLGLSAVLRPWFQWLPRHLPRLQRADAPRLFGLIDEVAAVVGTRGVDVVVLDPGFNAYVTRYGPRRRGLCIGLTLWETLTPSRRVALLGHELGHYANGDCRHGFFVGNALYTLALWAHVLNPGRWRKSRMRHYFATFVLRWPYYLVDGTLRLLERLTLHGSARREYLADGLSAQAASTEAAVGLAQGLLYGGAAMAGLDAAIEGEVLDWRTMPWRAAAEAVRRLPEQERERLHRVSQLEWHYEDDTHPPTHLRIELLERRPERPGAVHFDRKAVAAVERELERAVWRLIRRLR
ncbi:M48 family metalloprotease [Streptomyces sp. NBC_01304]|uniref:M48 family metalloprotease n=1 Tax=Streptomyces sp. NBC_01304 TaxID=2903818 RepID=UPI002E123F4A|nr:M48 family metalloprotease [Streptomyces sp. NBC_01304]